MCDNQAPHSLHFRNFWCNSLSHLLFLSFGNFNIHPAAISFLSFAFLHPTARVSRRIVLQLRPNGEMSRAHAAASGHLPTARVGACHRLDHVKADCCCHAASWQQQSALTASLKLSESF